MGHHTCDFCGYPSATSVCLPCAEAWVAERDCDTVCLDLGCIEGEDVDDAVLDAAIEALRH